MCPTSYPTCAIVVLESVCVTDENPLLWYWFAYSASGCSVGWFSENVKPPATVVLPFARSRDTEVRPVVAR